MNRIPKKLPETLPAGMRALSGRVAKSELKLCTSGHLYDEIGPYYYGKWEKSTKPDTSFIDCTPAGLDWSSLPS